MSSDVREIVKLVTGRTPGDAEIARVTALAHALDVPARDPMFALIAALDSIYGGVAKQPDVIETRIAAAMKTALAGVERSAREIADAALAKAAGEAHVALAKAVAGVADKVAVDVARKSMARWAVGAVAIAFAALLVAGWLSNRHGYSAGYADAFVAMGDEKSRASWANTPEGHLAYGLARAGSIQVLASCDAPGWSVESHVCYPGPTPSGTVRGWRLTPIR